MSTSSPDGGPPSEPACDVFYLRVEPHIGGVRWAIAKSGTLHPVLVGPVFPSDHAARVSGRAGLERFLAQQNSWTARDCHGSSVGRSAPDRSKSR